MNECDIFMGALEIDSPPERDQYVQQMCGGDTTLQQRVETLLQSHSQAGSLLEHPAAELAATSLVSNTDHVPSQNDSPTVSLPSGSPLTFLAASDRLDSLGRFAQYEILEMIGRGGMGIVLKAEDTKLHRLVAIKVLAPELASNPTARRRFLREAQAAAAISHDHVVTLHAVQENERADGAPLPYLVMELIDGQSLQQKIDQQGPLELKEILRIGRQIASGLAEAHAQGLIHRDVKPSNILLQNGIERVQITDFGLARAVDDVDITRTGEVTGTPQYMSPEQAQGLSIDTRSDLFSLGSVLYAMCTGRSPFRAESTMASLRRVCDVTPRPIREINAEIPDWLTAIVERLLEKNPDDRFQTASEVAELLGRHLAYLQDPGSSPFPGTIPSAKRRSRSRPWQAGRWITAGLVLIALAAMLGVTEATGVTHLSATVVRVVSGEGTLVIEVDDPTVQIALDGEELSISGGGLQELKLRPGQYHFEATKDGRPIQQELVRITRGDREIVRVSRTPPANVSPPPAEAAEYTCSPAGALTEVDRHNRPTSNAPIAGLDFSPTGRQLLCHWSWDTGPPALWDLDTGVVNHVEALGGQSRGPVAIAPNGELAAFGRKEPFHVRLWNLRSGESVRDLQGHTSYVRTVTFSSDGDHLLSASFDGTARIWDVATGNEIQKLTVKGDCYFAQFTPDAQSVFAGGNGVTLFDADSGAVLWTAPTWGQAKCGAMSADGRYAAAGTQWTNSIHIWDLTSREEVRRLIGHEATVRSVQFLPDGRHLVSGAEDRTLRLWNIETRAEVTRITHQEDFSQHIAVSPDGRHVATGGGTQKDRRPGAEVIVWRLNEAVWHDQTRAATTEIDIPTTPSPQQETSEPRPAATDP